MYHKYVSYNFYLWTWKGLLSIIIYPPIMSHLTPELKHEILNEYLPHSRDNSFQALAGRHNIKYLYVRIIEDLLGLVVYKPLILLNGIDQQAMRIKKEKQNERQRRCREKKKKAKEAQMNNL